MKPKVPKLWRSLRTRVLGGVIATLFGLSVFFTIQVELQRRSLKQIGEGDFTTGAVVSIVAAIDGDVLLSAIVAAVGIDGALRIGASRDELRVTA